MIDWTLNSSEIRSMRLHDKIPLSYFHSICAQQVFLLYGGYHRGGDGYSWFVLPDEMGEGGGGGLVYAAIKV